MSSRIATPGGDVTRLSALAEEIVRLKPDVIVAWPTKAGAGNARG
jgi:hypothetical protein